MVIALGSSSGSSFPEQSPAESGCRSADLPVEAQDSVMAADRHEFRYEEPMR